MLANTDAAFDGPMILFQGVIKILHRSVLAVLLQHTLVFELHNRRRVSGMLVGVDDSRRRMVCSAERFGEKALGRGRAPLGEQLLHVTVGKREAQVPADRKQDHLRFKLAPLEQPGNRWNTEDPSIL